MQRWGNDVFNIRFSYFTKLLCGLARNNKLVIATWLLIHYDRILFEWMLRPKQLSDTSTPPVSNEPDVHRYPVSDIWTIQIPIVDIEKRFFVNRPIWPHIHINHRTADPSENELLKLTKRCFVHYQFLLHSFWLCLRSSFISPRYPTVILLSKSQNWNM